MPTTLAARHSFSLSIFPVASGKLDGPDSFCASWCAASEGRTHSNHEPRWAQPSGACAAQHARAVTAYRPRGAGCAAPSWRGGGGNLADAISVHVVPVSSLRPNQFGHAIQHVPVLVSVSIALFVSPLQPLPAAAHLQAEEDTWCWACDFSSMMPSRVFGCWPAPQCDGP